MAEESQVGFLFKAASSLQTKAETNPSLTILKSFYLMRCREVAKDQGLPVKYFSSKVRCSHCFLEWNQNTETKVRAIKLSKRQKRRIRQYKITNKNKEYVKSRQDMLNSNEMEQICSFCKHSDTTNIVKPSKPKLSEPSRKRQNVTQVTSEKATSQPKTVKKVPEKVVEVNVYSKAKDVYSLNNKNNALPSTVKEKKVIKNNKKKKDKFAGLCQQAVLASAKMKQEKDKLNKLNLFLRPSS